MILQIDQGLGARAAALINGDEGFGSKAMLFDNSLNKAGQPIGAAAFTRHDNEFNGFLGLSALR